MLLFTYVAIFSLLHCIKALEFHCADFSSLPIIEQSGVVFKDNGAVAPFEKILARHGLNLARIRVWTAGDYDLANSLALAKRAKNAGMSLLIDLHFSDSWADPGKQFIPSSWPTTLSGLNTQINEYTLSLVQSFADQGTPIDFIEVGNEINSGILWPVGEISVNGYSPLSQLLHSAISGIRKGSPKTKTVIHLANGWDQASISSFYEQVFIAGELSTSDVDVMGFSFYPFYGTGATLDALKESLSNITSKYEKDVMVVETDWPVSCNGTALSEPSIPVSVQGQQTWVGDIRSVLQDLGSKSLGICYWEPGWVGSAALGSSCADNLLVNSNGTTRASINMFFSDM